nr:Dullard phosphatase domain, eukaryotic [Tanacetum cinerariifolium]
MATHCMNSNLLPKTTIAERISKPRKPSSKSYKFLFEYANRNHLLLPTNYYYFIAGDFSTTLLPPNSLNQRTLVLDLDEMLIHSTVFCDTSIPITPPVNYDFLVTFGAEVAYVKKRPSYKLQPENGIPIKRFIDDLHDDELKKLMDNFFKSCDKYEDLKDALKHYRDLNLKLRFNTLHELR